MGQIYRTETYGAETYGTETYGTETYATEIYATETYRTAGNRTGTYGTAAVSNGVQRCDDAQVIILDSMSHPTQSHCCLSVLSYFH